MSKFLDCVVALFLVGCLAFLAILTYAGVTYEEKDVPVTVTCIGDYRVFIRGDQFDVLFSEECERENVRPPLLGA